MMEGEKVPFPHSCKWLSYYNCIILSYNMFQDSMACTKLYGMHHLS